MKKIITIAILGLMVILAVYYAFIYFVPYSEGVRSGELIKISHKGVVVKTWEGEISQGVSGAQIFTFSVLDKDEQVIEKLQEYQGNYVKLHYTERFATFFWLGDTKYFVTQVEKERSPHLRN
ncbi:6-phosphogluconate dehydrogenase [Maribacter sp. 2-571]|uniref:6-phosphogluconate dehydrogenase n=1 Tax=Maribacter sp. 2-571 TaxID=3417569 RepID=UPI003D3475FC